MFSTVLAYDVYFVVDAAVVLAIAQVVLFVDAADVADGGMESL